MILFHLYLIQEDTRGNISTLFPKEGRGFVEASKDYWIPRSGKAYTLDDTKGEEKIYLLALSSPLDEIVGGISPEHIKRAARSIITRAIYVKPVNPSISPSVPEIDPSPSLSSLCQRIEGQGGLVKVVRFVHE